MSTEVRNGGRRGPASVSMSVLGFVFALAASDAAAASLNYRVIDDDRSWANVGGWYTTGGEAYGKLPTNSDYIYLKGTDLAWPTPLVITNGMAVKTLTLTLAEGASSRASLLVREGGSFTMGGSGGSKWFSCGYQGRGLMVNDGGTLNFYANSGFMIGDLAGSYGVYSNHLGSARFGGGPVSIGNNANATGVVCVAGGTFYDNNWNSPGTVYIGNRGVGKFILSGGSFDGCSGVSDAAGGGKVVAYLGRGEGGAGEFLMSGGNLKGVGFQIGYATNSVGKMVVTGGTCGYTREFKVGINGTGSLDVRSDFKEGELRIGGLGRGSGRVTVRAGVTNTVQYLYNQCSGYVHVGGGTSAENGGGELVLEGGSVRQNGGGHTYVGAGESTGLVRGWGRFLTASLTDDWVTSHTIHIGTNGVVCADGFGTDRMLDFNRYYLVDNMTDDTYVGTNGWYAVNGGGINWPFRDYAWASTVTRCLGDTAMAPAPRLVNSVQISIRGTAGGTFHGGVYAADRTDCHLDSLPQNNGILGVWKLGTHTEFANWGGWDAGTPVKSFSTVKVKFRYDDRAVRGRAARLALFRWQGGAWVRVAKKNLTGTDDEPYIETDYLGRITDDPANIGTFALAEVPQYGMTLILR